MNRKKWQGTACLLLASLMMSSVFAAPVRKEAPTPKATTMPKATPAPSTMPQATTAPAPSTMPQATTTPAPSTMPQATTTPAPSTMPKATTTPQAVESPKVTPCPTTEAPKATEMPQKEVAPTKPDCKKVHQNEKNVEKQKPFTLDHFKMIVNALKKMGVEENQIVTYVKEGKKLEDILKAEKINTKKFKKCITKEYFKVVDEAVKTGQITAEQSKQLKAAIKETIKNWLPKK